VSEALVAWVAEAALPVIVRVEVAAGVVALVVTVSVELPPAVTVVGLNEAVAPVGRPEAARVIVSALPATSAVETV
jgi:hypothetical protein